MNVNLAIQPYNGVGQILLGNTSEDIREVIAHPFRSFKKGPSSSVPADQFSGVGVIIFYKPPNVCNAIELNRPATPTFEDRTLLGESFQIIRSWLGQFTKETFLDGAGVAFLELGISLYTGRGIDDPDSVVESVLVFERGYYDALLERQSRRRTN